MFTGKACRTSVGLRRASALRAAAGAHAVPGRRRLARRRGLAVRAQVGRLSNDRVSRRRRGLAAEPRREADEPLLSRARRPPRRRAPRARVVDGEDGRPHRPLARPVTRRPALLQSRTDRAAAGGCAAGTGPGPNWWRRARPTGRGGAGLGPKPPPGGWGGCAAPHGAPPGAR